jgi:hypothetical protein
MLFALLSTFSLMALTASMSCTIRSKTGKLWARSSPTSDD